MKAFRKDLERIRYGMNDKKTITVLTPTFNRKQTLCALYQSLANQTCKDFDWFVVDDGSTDDTGTLIKRWQKEAAFSIFYIYKENGGKHTALNKGIKRIETDLTFIVDSDDTLKKDAIETILQYHNRYKDINSICGYVFLREYPDGTVNGKIFEPNERIDTYIEMRINRDDTYSDKAEVFFTRRLKEFPFPEYTGERFLGEDLVWIRMARKYSMVHINKAIYVCDYRKDGLTKNRRKNNINAPVGCMNRGKEFMTTDIKIRYRMKGGLQYIIYGKFAGYRIGALMKESRYKVLTFICTFPGMLIYHIWKKEQ